MSHLIIVGNFEYRFGNSLSDKDHKLLIDIIAKYQNIFVKYLNKNCRFNKSKFKITTLKQTPCKRSKLNRRDNDILKRKVTDLVRSGILEESQSLWGSPVYIKWKNSDPEMHVDYYDVNRHTTYDTSHDVPNKKEILNSIKPSRLFSVIVLKDPFHQLELEKHSKKKTAFETDFGIYQFTTMTNHLKNSQKYLHSAMETAFGTDPNFNFNSIVFFLGEILIFTDDYDEHFDTLNQIFGSLKECNLKVDVIKSSFIMKEVNFAGYKISRKGIGIDPFQLDRIYDFKSPENKAQLKAFLDLASKLREYFEDFNFITKELYELIDKTTDKDIKWSWEYQEQFNDVLRELSKAKPIAFGEFK